MGSGKERTQEGQNGFFQILKSGSEEGGQISIMTFNTCRRPFSELQFSHFYNKRLFITFLPNLKKSSLQREVNLETKYVTM